MDDKVQQNINRNLNVNILNVKFFNSLSEGKFEQH